MATITKPGTRTAQSQPEFTGKERDAETPFWGKEQETRIGDVGILQGGATSDIAPPSVFTPANRGPGWDGIASLLTL
jgi:hypothetical protein